MRYNKALSLSDFSNPAFRNLTREVFAHWSDNYPNFPDQLEQAKVWEVCQAVRGLADHGALSGEKEVLGVGAGHEHTVFYLTKFVKRVFATDLYHSDTEWQEAPSKMLTNPETFAVPSLKWSPKRLVTQYMNALDLRFEDESFDGIFSCGSIEHFGSLENVAMAAREMGRVLKRGGILALSTEYRVSGPDGDGIPGAILFTAEMLQDYIIGPSGLVPVDPFDGQVEEETSREAYPLEAALRGERRDRSIALTSGGYLWTSAALCLRKA
jgi:SAM-dependent methyltransferase